MNHLYALEIRACIVVYLFATGYASGLLTHFWDFIHVRRHLAFFTELGTGDDLFLHTYDLFVLLFGGQLFGENFNH